MAEAVSAEYPASSRRWGFLTGPALRVASAERDDPHREGADGRHGCAREVAGVHLDVAGRRHAIGIEHDPVLDRSPSGDDDRVAHPGGADVESDLAAAPVWDS